MDNIVERLRDWGHPDWFYVDTDKGPNTPKGIVIRFNGEAGIGGGYLNEQTPHADTGEVRVWDHGVAWFGRFGR